jgi:hypothetical protein
MKPGSPDVFLERFTGIVKKKRTKKVDIKRIIEAESGERHRP